MRIKYNIYRLLSALLIIVSSCFFSNSLALTNHLGSADWSDSIIMSPRYMGPNAIPVPEIRTGKINDSWEVTTRFGYRFFEYDNTVDLIC